MQLDGSLADSNCSAAKPDPAHYYLCTMCLADMPAYVTQTEAGVHAQLKTLCTAGGSYIVYDHVCPNGVRQLGFIANGGEVWYFAPSGELLGYRYQTDVISTGECPSGADAYGDTTCSDWTGSVYTTPNTTVDCDAGHQDAYVPDAKSDTDDASADVPIADAEFSDVPVDADSPQMCTVPGTDKCSDTNLSCQCCPAGGPMNHCLCAESCTTSGDCKDPARPECKIGPGTKTGFCAPTSFTCCWLCM